MNLSSVVKAPVRKALNRLDGYRDERNIRNLFKAKNLPAHDYLSRYPMPALVETQRNDIDAFWAQYGIKILDYSWYRWYYGVTGIIDPRFIPQDIYSYVIWPYHDNEEFCLAWKDKNHFEKFCPDVPFPHNYLRCINGRFFDGNGSYLPDREQVISTLKSIRGG